MKTVILILIFLLLMSFSLAEISVQTGTSGPENIVYEIDAGDGAISFTPNIDVLETYVFVDGEQIAHFDKLFANATNFIKTENGVHAFEIRSLVEQNYFWDNYKVTENDYPFYLSYATYDKDKKKINFAVKGADAVHPEDLSRTGKSIKKKFEDYSALLNNQVELECYPLITTGKQVPFNCYSLQYAYTLNISFTIGFVENTTVNVTGMMVKHPLEPVINDSLLVVEETLEDFVNEEVTLVENSQPEKEPSGENNISAEVKSEGEPKGNDWIILLLLIIIVVVIVGFLAKKKQKPFNPLKTEPKSFSKKPEEKIKVNKIKKVKRMP